MKEKEKRIVKGYKITQTSYNRAMKRAKKDKVALATLIEIWVAYYSKYKPYCIDERYNTKMPE